MFAGTSYATGPGSYALPTLDAALSAVRAAHGARSHLSAALHWGWELKAAPPLPMITVPRGRNLSERRRIGMQVFWAHLTEDELEAGVTAPLRTVVDCAQRLPWDVALTVADSALRSGAVTHEELLNAAEAVPGEAPSTGVTALRQRPMPARPARSSQCSGRSPCRCPGWTSFPRSSSAGET